MKQLSGTVVSTKLAKTAVVQVETKWQHPLYKKTIKRTKKYLVHDQKGAKTGDQVVIQENKPISKKKRWIISQITSA